MNTFQLSQPLLVTPAFPFMIHTARSTQKKELILTWLYNSEGHKDTDEKKIFIICLGFIENVSELLN